MILPLAFPAGIRRLPNTTGRDADSLWAASLAKTLGLGRI
jgi:hypothetical protein